MSGHSKWAGIKHKKGLADAKRGKLFSKLAKEMAVAAKVGGGSVDTNPRLRLAVSKAKEANMPSDNIKRAIKKGTGELPGVNYEQINYEGYGPGGVAIVVEVLTDNKNRTTAEIRNIFSKRSGNLAGAGSVIWQFTRKGFIVIDKAQVQEDKLMSIAIESGAEDLKTEDDSFEITTNIKDYEAVRKALEDNNITWQAAEITMIPSSYVKLEGNQANQILGLVELLEDQDDVQNVYANFDIPEKILQEHAE